MYFNSSLVWHYSNEELNTTKSEKPPPFLKVHKAKIFLQGSFLLYVWNLSCYDSLKIKYAKLQAELSFACAETFLLSFFENLILDLAANTRERKAGQQFQI